MNRRGWIGSSLLLVMVVAAGVGLAAWKYASIQEATPPPRTNPSRWSR